MTALVKGLVEIIKTDDESSDDYKLKVAKLLYELQASYKGLSRETYSTLPDWHPEKVSKLEEEPCEISESIENRELFIEHHLAHGWNKDFNIDNSDSLLQETIYGSNADADDGDFIHWVRNDGNQKRYFDVYLLKYAGYPWVADNGVSLINGVMFAEKFNIPVYDKIKRVVTRFSEILRTHRLLNRASIDKHGFIEVLRFSGQDCFWKLEQIF